LFGDIEKLLELVGAEKVVCASELTDLAYPATLRQKVGEEYRCRILGSNMQKVLNEYCTNIAKSESDS